MLVFSPKTRLNSTLRHRTRRTFLSFVLETAGFVNLAWWCWLRLLALLLGFPLAGWATVYKWTDEHGTTVYSNRAPAAETKVSNVQVVMQDEEPAAAPKPTNANDLQARVRALEQQVQSLQGQAPGYPAPPDYY